MGIDDARFADETLLQEWCDRIGSEGLRGTGSAAHERVIAWIEDELAQIPGVTIRSDEYEIQRWQPVPDDLERAGGLRAVGSNGGGRRAAGSHSIRVAGAVPYTMPGHRAGALTYLASGTTITNENARGKVVLRDFPDIRVPYDLLLGRGLFATPGCDALRGGIWDRPGLADGILHEDLLAAGAAGAAGVIIAFDLPRDQVAGYYEPHKGTHYRVPAVFVGVDEREQLRQLTADGGTVEISVQADVTPGTTRNVFATLPGQTEERIILVTHTDGNTWVQENGAAALLALAHYFATVPIEHRYRTLEFAFTSAHLHISREGAARYAEQLDREFDEGNIAFVFPIEHLGARELVPVSRTDGPGRRLAFAAGAEVLLWAVGPSAVLRQAVIDAVTLRKLDRVLVAPGFGAAVDGQVPRIVSFGGLGTYFNVHLVPTTSILTGPWSLWAPAFKGEAIDVATMRQQVLAAAEVVAALDRVPRDAIGGDYLADRAARAAGAPVGVEYEPPEFAPA
jgi:hypothetical protein